MLRLPFARLALTLALLAAAGACADSGGVVPPSLRDRASIAIRPVLLGAPAFAAPTVDRLRVVLYRDAVVLLDTTVSVSPGSDTVAVELRVRLTANEERLGARVQLLSGTTVLYDGRTDVLARVGGSGSSAPANIGVRYIGPGSGVARISLSPRDTTLVGRGAMDFRLTATDSSGRAVPDVPLFWFVSDAKLAAVEGLRLTPAGGRGRVAVRALTPTGITDEVSVTLVPAATRLGVSAGAGQSATVGETLALPFVVEVLADDGGPVPGVRVAFGARDGGAVSPATTLSDAAGRASARLTLGRTAGTQTFVASVAGVPEQTVTASALAAAAAKLSYVSGSGQVDTAGHILKQPLLVRATDAFENPVQGAKVLWQRIAGDGAAPAPTVTVTNAGGLASIGYQLGSTARTDSVTATLVGTSQVVLFTMRSIKPATSPIAPPAAGAMLVPRD